MEAKNIPYGLTDFARIRKDNYYYVDKTQYIPLIERAAPYFFLIRPRRFGKSLLINVLTWYYDINRKDRFEEVFGGCRIADTPTAEQGKYLILSFNFSDVNPMPDKVFESFEQHCSFRFMEFAGNYERFFEPGFRDELMAKPTADAKFSYLVSRATQCGLPIYLFIDEYDNFANSILAREGHERYHALTHSEGFFRYFFNKIKAGATGDGPIKRMFITGVSPVTMDDVTSGFNIGANMSADSRFNGLVGFSEEELREILTYYDSQGMLADSVDDLIGVMKPWYDNYCFSKRSLKEPMYNSDMVLYFLNNYLPHQEAPDQMIDNNIRTDYNKLRHLIRVDKTFGVNASIIQDVVANGSIMAEINSSFPAEAIVLPENFKSLLYYFGLLSIREVSMGRTILGIPNLTVREQLYTYLIEAYREAYIFNLDFHELEDLVWKMAYQGEWESVFRYFAGELDRQSRVREFIEGEAHVKGFLLAYLGMVGGYIIQPEYESAKGYADFYMMPDLLHQPDIAYSYIVEVKYAHRDATEANIEALRREAAVQLQRYAADPLVAQTKGNTCLGLITLVFKGWELVVCEKD